MSRILVVEPRNVLRQAISLALFPDHEVQTATFLLGEQCGDSEGVRLGHH